MKSVRFGMRHAFYYYDMLWRPLKALSCRTACDGQPINKSALYSSQTSPAPTHRPQRLGCPQRKIQAKSLESTARDSRRRLRLRFHVPVQ